MSIGLDFQGIILFLVFVTPGFLLTRTYLSYRPRYYKQPNAFEQTALALIGSTIIHSTMLAVVTLAIMLMWLFSRRWFTIGMLVGSSVPIDQYPLQIAAFYLNMLVGYLLLSLYIARRAGILLGKKMPGTMPNWWNNLVGEDPPENLLLWHVVLQDEPLRMGTLSPQISVRLRNGDHVAGQLTRLKLVGNEDNTIELALTDVQYQPAPATEPPTPLPQQTLLLNSTDILWLTRIDG